MTRTFTKKTDRETVPLSDAEKAKILRLSAKGMSGRKIAEKIGRPAETVCYHRRQLGYFGRYETHRKTDPPTPYEIKKRAAEIRKEWTEAERQKRASGSLLPTAWQVPASRERAAY